MAKLRAGQIVIKAKFVPGGSNWMCSVCGRPMDPGEVVICRGNKRYCNHCQGKSIN